jgi:Kef-type K+ transport system membrane component KefB
MEEFYPFFLVIFSGVFFSMVFRRIHVPWVVGLILGGVVIGPHVFNVLSITPTMEFIAQIGLIFLMFMAGLESKFSKFNGFKWNLLWLSFINGAVPFVVGIVITLFFGYGILPALLVGIVFISSSIAVVIPSLERHNLLNTKLGQSVVMTSVIQDIGSLILLSIVLQNIDPITSLPLIIFYPLVIGVLIFLRILLPIVRKLFTLSISGTQDLFQQEFRTVFLVLVGTVIAFELIGLHPIIAGFFVGLVLSGSITSSVLKEKIRTISYGIFIPTFFILIGIQTDISVFLNIKGTITLTVAIVIGSVLSKFLSGWLGGISVGFTRDQALLFGISSVPQLSTTLAVAFAALSLDLIDQRLIASLIALSIITVVVSPVLMNILGNKIRESIPAPNSH